MNNLLLGRGLGDLTSQTFQRLHFQQKLQSLSHNAAVSFTARPKTSEDVFNGSDAPSIAHKAGTNCIAIDQVSGRYLLSGGADTAISLWDLETFSNNGDLSHTYQPVATVTKANQSSHTHAITSLSIYPFDPIPQTLLTTSYDQSLLLSSITPTSILPVHKFPLDFTAHTHSICPVADSSTPLVAVGTAHPAPRLIDLRSALSTHSLPGHTGAIYSLAWHPRRSHILVSSSTDGRILVFDIRRATPAFASLDADDSLGMLDGTARAHLDYTHRAHSAPITGIVFTDSPSGGEKLLSASHDQRIRLWDMTSGRNELVHFGPRIRNSRNGELKPSLPPTCTAGGSGAKPGRELLFWPNDDGRGEIHVHELHEGANVRVMKTQNLIQRIPNQDRGKRKSIGRAGRGQQLAAVDRLTSGGRINSIAWRPIWADWSNGAVEMYTAHGDGRICAWTGDDSEDLDEGDDDENDETDRGGGDDDDDDVEKGMKKRKKTSLTAEEVEEERKRKRKRDLIGDLVEGLTKRPVTFS